MDMVTALSDDGNFPNYNCTSQVHHLLVIIITVNLVKLEVLTAQHITVQMCYGMANNVMDLTTTAALILTCLGVSDNLQDQLKEVIWKLEIVTQKKSVKKILYLKAWNSTYSECYWTLLIPII